MKLISFVLPIYNEEASIPKLYAELIELKNKIDDTKYNVEFIFVNDGSADNSFEMLKELHKKNPKEVRVVGFTRNYGHQVAVTAGQDCAEGDAVIIMDTDLQDPPEVCLDLIKKWEEGFDIVYAQRRRYKTNFFKEKSAFFFYRLLKKISSVDIPVDTGDFRLLSRRVNLEMRKYKEKAKYLRGISSLTGYKKTGVLFDRSDRYAGKPQYTFSKSLKLAVDGITGFSLFPLKMITFCGFLFSLSSFLFGFCYIFYSIFSGSNISGWASLMSVVIFIGGVQMLMLGVMGEYLGRVYTEVLDRPLYTVDEKLGFEKKS